VTPLTTSPLAPDVQLGSDLSLGANVIIHDHVIVGDGCTLEHGAVLGKLPKLSHRSRSRRGHEPQLVLEPGCVVCCYAVVVAGARIGAGAVIGDHAFIREDVRIGRDSVVGQGASVGRGVVIGDRVRLQSGVMVAHGSVIEDDVFFGPAVAITNDPAMGRHEADLELRGIVARRACRIGASVVLLPGVEIGEEAVVAAGSVVTRSVAARTVVMGVPARHVRDVSEDELVERWGP
jgi:acetyltransferase-like isoleucine patch superfamily enzyme